MLKPKGIYVIEVAAALRVAGTRINVAHGLGYAPAARSIIVVPTGDNDDVDQAQAFAVVGTDATNIVLKPTEALTSGCRIFVFVDRQAGGSNDLV